MDLIIQARTNSSRLPNKLIYKAYNDETFLEYFYKRVCKSTKINRIIIATTDSNKDDIIEDICKLNNWLYFRGSENDVLDRFYKCCTKFNVKNIIRVTSDCPLIDYRIIDIMIDKFIKNNDSCLSLNYHGKHGFPDGFNPEICTFKALEMAWNNTTLLSDREHVLPYIKRNMLTTYFTVSIPTNIKWNINFDSLHLSLDTIQDLINLRKIIYYFHKEKMNDDFTYINVLEYLNTMNTDNLKLFYREI